jgi:hypothetical protein
LEVKTPKEEFASNLEKMLRASTPTLWLKDVTDVLQAGLSVNGYSVACEKKFGAAGESLQAQFYLEVDAQTSQKFSQGLYEVRLSKPHHVAFRATNFGANIGLQDSLLSSEHEFHQHLLSLISKLIAYLNNS